MVTDVAEEHTVSIFHFYPEDARTFSFKILVNIYRVTSRMTAVLVSAGMLIVPKSYGTVIIQLTASLTD
jgi:hypothetical protein